MCNIYKRVSYFWYKKRGYDMRVIINGKYAYYSLFYGDINTKKSKQNCKRYSQCRGKQSRQKINNIIVN